MDLERGVTRARKEQAKAEAQWAESQALVDKLERDKQSLEAVATELRQQNATVSAELTRSEAMREDNLARNEKIEATLETSRLRAVADRWEAVEAERAKWEARESKYEARENRLIEEITALQAEKEECSTEATNQRCKRETADKELATLQTQLAASQEEVIKLSQGREAA